MLVASPTLRRAGPADSAGALELVAAALHEHALPFDPAATDADLADFETHYFKRGGDFAVLIDAAGSVVGSCGLYPVAPGVIEIRKMYVAPALRGTGQGRRLLDWAFARSRELGFRRIRLETASVLKAAIALYEQNGFRRDAEPCQCCRCDLAYSREL
ncbi:MAG TPA: GNAT family N-acetyltransferase [Candidatus Didemnitutus sp.]|nr:GNAT family N-acetyltransferase [Candidatus Didemnitutus sp.]